MPITLNGTEGVDQSAVTGATELPRGTTAQRPASPTAGMIRFNTDFNVYESYDGTSWNATAYNANGYSIQVEYLVIAGGGGGGLANVGLNQGGGAGGAGGYLAATDLFLSLGTSYTVTVGAGGNGTASSAAVGSNGSNSVFSTITSTGGGGGGSNSPSGGSSGGSGGGGGLGEDRLKKTVTLFVRVVLIYLAMLWDYHPPPSVGPVEPLVYAVCFAAVTSSTATDEVTRF